TNTGRTFSIGEAEKILVKKTQRNGLGLLNMGLADSGDDCFSHFKLQQLRSLGDKELEAAAVNDQIFDRDPQFILADRQFKRRGEDLRRCVDDQYKDIFSHELNKQTARIGIHSEVVEKIRGLEDFIRKDLTRKGLDIICRKAEACDLGRVRQTLKGSQLQCSIFDIDYLRKFGEWEDIPLLLDLVGRPETVHNRSLLAVPEKTNMKLQHARYMRWAKQDYMRL
ncbi:MAG: hypothetical protein R8K20_06985, partial [Gallionellaceae bacterium]